jgi:predicted transcriptional regulator
MRADYKQRRRDRYEVVADMLSTCRESTSTVQLLKRANTNHAQLKLIAPELISGGLLERNGTSYRTTKRGLGWLRLYRQLRTGTVPGGLLHPNGSPRGDLIF